jgi:hypothetical protein
MRDKRGETGVRIRIEDIVEDNRRMGESRGDNRKRVKIDRR